MAPAVLDSFLQGRQRREEAAAAAAGQSLEQVQLAVAAELIHNYGCCQKATLACLHQPIPAVVHVYSSCDKNDIRLAVCGAGEARCARRGLGEGRAAAPRAESAAAPRAESAKAPARRAARRRTGELRVSERETSLYGFRMARRIFDTQIHKVHTQGLEQGRK